MIELAADGTGLELKAHPHMLRHACGYALANKGHDDDEPVPLTRPVGVLCIVGRLSAPNGD
jgi:hypothetical protein